MPRHLFMLMNPWVLEGSGQTLPLCTMVPTLAELLKPAAESLRSFKVDPACELVNVGLAVDRLKFDDTLQTTHCSDRHSGNG